MTEEEKRLGVEHLLQDCPPVLTVRTAAPWIRHGTETLYQLIHNGELRSYRYRGKFLISKADLIDFMVSHTDVKDGKLPYGKK